MAPHPIDFLVITAYNYRVFLTNNLGSGPTFSTFKSFTYSQSFAQKSKIKNQKSKIKNQKHKTTARAYEPPPLPPNTLVLLYSYTLVLSTLNIYLLKYIKY